MDKQYSEKEIEAILSLWERSKGMVKAKRKGWRGLTKDEAVTIEDVFETCLDQLHGRISKFAWRWVQKELYKINFPSREAAEEQKQ